METNVHFIQTDKSSSYIPGACQCFACTAFTAKQQCNTDENQIRDWVIKEDVGCCATLCADQNQCVPFSKKICETKSFKKGHWNGAAPKAVCYYDLNKLKDNLPEIQTLITKFGINQRFMWDVCKIPNNIDGKLYNPIHVSGKKGDLCREWYNHLGNGKAKFLREYCVSYPNAEDCKCVNRKNDPIYREFKKHNAINDGCWYLPCNDTSNQFVEEHLIKKDCPKILCSSVIKIVGNTGTVNIDKIKSSIVCGDQQKETVNTNAQVSQVQEKLKKPIPLEKKSNNFFIALVSAIGLTAATSLFI